MSVQVICDKDNLFRFGVQYIGCVSEHFRKIQCCPGFRHNRFSSACQRLGDHEDICDTITDIYGIHFLRLPWFTWNTDFFYKLLIGFIYAYNRIERIIRTLVNFQYILHFGHEFSICLRNAPFLYKPRFDLVFFITSQTVLSVI